MILQLLRPSDGLMPFTSSFPAFHMHELELLYNRQPDVANTLTFSWHIAPAFALRLEHTLTFRFFRIHCIYSHYYAIRISRLTTPSFHAEESPRRLTAADEEHRRHSCYSHA